MVEDIHDISYELTGSELIALLLENEEIKRLLPKYNQAQRRNTFHFGIFSEPNEHGYLELSIRRLNDKDRPEASFTTRFAAEGALKRRIERHNLCMNLCGMSTGPGACFHHQIHQCKGACVQKENPDAYNARVEAAIETLNYGRSNFFIVGDGRNYEEKSVVKIENGVYTGYAYMYETEMRTPTAIASHIPYKPESPDVLNIIRNYIKKKPKEVKPWG
jgi:DNA polymerase-3 subunit epsilon